ncbi:uncharacterized protein LOC108740824 [Agrilus planipennis]|uniref:Uncharacterized protein LOC108740824 n=1 Tax=Agrilus planipennis TaxID=224129 RepID=A0A1W4X3W6_AGRPL|nr:uncharacterized protein LOC108740824 [Agrilus planipennis]XP_018330816.1 uncharacterized protein LOC108740824 [Agrilus planipennis]
MAHTQQLQSSLKRSQKTDFTTSTTLTKERSFIRTNKDPHKRKSQTMATIKGKPTMEIYRPPNVRTDSGVLNVHAKEFTMNHDLKTSKSSANLAQHIDFQAHGLQHSSSSGNILRHIHGSAPFIPIVPAPMVLPPLLHSASTHVLLNHHYPRVNFQIANNSNNNSDALSQQTILPNLNHAQHFTNFNNNHHGSSHGNLKRSKSLGAADSRNLIEKLKSFSKEETNLGKFPSEDQSNLDMAIDDPNQLPSRTLMDLVKVILERVVEGIRYSEAGAKTCISIIDREKNQTFLESLLNTCQQWYQERDKILRGVKAGDGTRFTAFMWFLTEMCGQLKRHKLLSKHENLQPDLVLLSVLAKCCQACVSLPITCLPETECLFFVLTSIGRDLESELPVQLEQLLASVRDAFLASAGSPAVRRTLLQLIELHASNWQLPGSSVLYYYPRIK